MVNKGLTLLLANLAVLTSASIYPIKYSVQGTYQGMSDQTMSKDSNDGLFVEKPQAVFSFGRSERKEQFPIFEEADLIKGKDYTISGKKCMWGKYSAHYSALR